MKYQVLDHEASLNEIKKIEFNNKRIGVLIHIEDQSGNILLQKRGANARDDIGLLENIGGGLDDTDESFKSAIKRELREEIGNEAIIEISDSMGIMYNTKNNTNWIFVIYFGKYKEGKLKIMEPDKCDEIIFMAYKELMKSPLVTDSCKFLVRNVKDHQKKINFNSSKKKKTLLL